MIFLEREFLKIVASIVGISKNEFRNCKGNVHRVLHDQKWHLWIFFFFFLAYIIYKIYIYHYIHDTLCVEDVFGILIFLWLLTYVVTCIISGIFKFISDNNKSVSNVYDTLFRINILFFVFIIIIIIANYLNNDFVSLQIISPTQNCSLTYRQLATRWNLWHDIRLHKLEDAWWFFFTNCRKILNKCNYFWETQFQIKFWMYKIISMYIFLNFFPHLYNMFFFSLSLIQLFNNLPTNDGTLLWSVK